MICTITGSPPITPVISLKTGHIYEKSTILTLLTTNGGKCPMTGIQLTEDDLLHVNTSGSSIGTKNTIGNSNNTTTSSNITTGTFVNTLDTLRTEWDSIMINQFLLTQQLEETKRELSQALYQNDAAVRVIARLTFERDEARGMMGVRLTQQEQQQQSQQQLQLQLQSQDTNQDEVMGDAPTQEGDANSKIPEKDLSVMLEVWKKLSSKRKSKITNSKSKISQANISTLQESMDAKTNLHKPSGKTGITSVSLIGSSSENNLLTVTSGNDKQIIIFDKSKGEIVQTIDNKGKSPVKRLSVNVNDDESGKNEIAALSQNGEIKLYGKNDDSEEDYSLMGEWKPENDGKIVSCTFHPSGEFIFLASNDGHVYILNLQLEQIGCLDAKEENVEYSSANLHPDGLIYIAGRADGKVDVWDLKGQDLASTLENEENVMVSSVEFSENGYHFAIGGNNGQVNIWDLRKQKISNSFKGYGKINDISFDITGKLVGFVGAEKGGVFTVKDGSDDNCLLSLGGGKKESTGIAFYDSGVVTVGLDRAVRFYE